ncbi:SufB/SufD family protein [Roseinatronobacter alkalisoli]|uniref:SufD family Fe-S cluster assembly protein n=1 Tax=Roseinatronobacter alkalisoli TaxID=3028235 RepID=A0ABT5TCW0_9RHOB|nr:SufD family Fe-S cluster assembly protein [Roseinatronobacter sp. HJB301]MDD7972530.1 SufD family Fe-S cluster assembly protein [Roseinatronobacter sp. HJB301]
MPRAKLKAQKRDAAQARLAALSLPQGGGWVTRARTAARARLLDMGLPVKRDEYWRYTDPRDLTSDQFAAAKVLKITDEEPAFSAVDRVKLVFVDGVFDALASDDPALAGVEISLLLDVANTDLHWAQDIYGKLEARGQLPVERPLAAFNTAFAQQGVLIRATAKAAKPVALVYLRSHEHADAIMHHIVRVEQGAELTLLENGPVAARFNQVIEAEIGAGGTLHHVRTQGRDHDRAGSAHLFAQLGQGAQLKSFTLTANGRLVRNEAMIWLDGQGGSAHIAGATVGDGAFHHDDTVFVTHGAQGGESRQVFKKVLRNGAVGVFQGKILVEQAAQQTDGYQISQALLLDENAQFLAKPELEIYADDVKCSHGSTSGEIDPAQLFYLRARGVPEAKAKMLLVLAFLAEALDEIADPDLAEDLRGRMESWLQRHS